MKFLSSHQIFNRNFIEYLDLVREHWNSLDYIKSKLWRVKYAVHDEHKEQILLDAKEAWDELGDDVMKQLWRAPRKGSVFTTKERRLLREAAEVAERRRIKE